MKKETKKRFCAAICLVMALCMCACGMGEKSEVAMMNNADFQSPMAEAAGGAADYGYASESLDVYEQKAVTEEGIRDEVQETESVLATTDRKLIRNVYLDVETKEFDQFMASVDDQVNILGGYIENMDTYNGSRYSGQTPVRHSSLTIRIPKAKVDSFLAVVSEAGNVTSRSENVEDVTLEYVDMESKRNALRIEQERLEAFLERAETLEEIIQLEDRLTDVRYQLESMESRLRTYDNKVDYATVRMSISEVKELTPVVEEEETVIERITNGFAANVKKIGNGFAEFFIYIAIQLPYYILCAVLIIVLILVVKLLTRKNRKKKAIKTDSTEAVTEKTEQTTEEK